MAGAVAQPQHLISVEEYLEDEKFSEVRHEHVEGHVYEIRVKISLANLYERTRVGRNEI